MSIDKEVREGIRAAAKGNEPVDKTLRRIIREVKDDMDVEFDFGRNQRTNIYISEDTKKKLERCKLNEKEPVAQVIKRAVILYNMREE